MYASYLREVPEDYFKRNRNIFKNDVYFFKKDELHNLREFIEKFGVDGLREVFDTIGIEYDSINDNGLTYTIDNKVLYTQDLSSCERVILYSIIMKKLKKPLIMIGLLDRLDREHIERLVNTLKDMNIVILSWGLTMRNCDVYDKYYKKFEELIGEGIV